MAINVKRSRSPGLALAIAVSILVLGPALDTGARAAEGDAKGILMAMSDYVRAQQTIVLTFDSAIEVITPQLEKIQFTNSGRLLASRPDKLRAERVGGYSHVELVFDGKTVNILSESLNAYVQIDAQGTIDQLIGSLRLGHGVALPGADLLLSSPYDALIADVIEAKHIGRGVVDGIECEHLAFRNFDTDWQLWVEVGDRPVPRKLVITSKTIAAAPQYTLRIKTWNTDVEPAADAFAFDPPADARVLGAEDLIMLDELPPPAPRNGGNQ